MRRSATRRAAPDPAARRRRRLIGAAGALVVFGGIIGVSQLSFADDEAARTKAITINGLEVLTNTCEDSQLEPHDGFQKGDRCVSTEFGEVPVAANNATLLITEAPETVQVGQAFSLKVSTRNLIRDRFLAAGQGGYYVESSILGDGGIVRGHFHTACRILGSNNAAPDPAPVPAFFVATEDRQGGKAPDTVNINIPGLPEAGDFQCSSWAGDGSHRIPMMERANQTPAFDSVRVRVEGAAEEPPAEEEPPGNGGGNNGGGNNGGGDNGGGNNGGGNNGGGDNGDNGGDQGGDNGNGGGDQGGDEGDQGEEAPPVTPGQPNTNVGTVTKPPAKPADKPTKESSKPAGSSSNSKSNSDSDEEEEAEPVQNLAKPKAEKPATTKSDAKKDDEAQADTTGGNFNPDAEPDPQTPVAAADTKDDSKLALTGTNTLAFAGGGVALVLIGFVIFSFTRRRRPRGNYYG